MFLLKALVQSVALRRDLNRQKARRVRAAHVRQLLVDLGPTFIKVGQFLSVRRDLLPAEVADELSLLQDRVPPLPISLVRATIEADLGGKPEDIFQYFETAPLASASIGQVHRAGLQDGRAAVVKVERPALAAIFYQDLGYMRFSARWAGRLGLAGAEFWLDLSDQFGQTLFAEIDYIQEGRSADRLRAMLRSYPQVKIPRVYWPYTGRRVLTLEYLPGTKIDQVEELRERGFNLRALGNLLVDCYLEQVVTTGFFHADPHAGNLAVDDRGNLIIYDFGMMGALSCRQRSLLASAVEAVCRRDATRLANHLFALGVVRSAQFVDPLARILQPIIDYYFGKNILDLNFQALELEVDTLAKNNALTLPPTLAYLVRTGASLEGIARTLRPNFSFAMAAKPWLTRLAIERGLLDLQEALAALAGIASVGIRKSLLTFL